MRKLLSYNYPVFGDVNILVEALYYQNLYRIHTSSPGEDGENGLLRKKG